MLRTDRSFRCCGHCPSARAQRQRHGRPELHGQAPKGRHGAAGPPASSRWRTPPVPSRRRVAAKDVILYNIISDQISEMRRKSALPTTMCIAESNGDGTAETVSRTLMARLAADNAQVEDSLFTIKHATECESAGQRMVDRETTSARC